MTNFVNGSHYFKFWVLDFGITLCKKQANIPLAHRTPLYGLGY